MDDSEVDDDDDDNVRIVDAAMVAVAVVDAVAAGPCAISNAQRMLATTMSCQFRLCIGEAADVMADAEYSPGDVGGGERDA